MTNSIVIYLYVWHLNQRDQVFLNGSKLSKLFNKPQELICMVTEMKTGLYTYKADFMYIKICCNVYMKIYGYFSEYAVDWTNQYNAIK